MSNRNAIKPTAETVEQRKAATTSFEDPGYESGLEVQPSAADGPGVAFLVQSARGTLVFNLPGNELEALRDAINKAYDASLSMWATGPTVPYQVAALLTKANQYREAAGDAEAEAQRLLDTPTETDDELASPAFT